MARVVPLHQEAYMGTDYILGRGGGEKPKMNLTMQENEQCSL